MILLPWVLSAQADVQRWAILVGNNQGASGARPLYFAEGDARKLSEVLGDLGGVPEENQRLLLGQNRFDVLSSYGAVKDAIAAAKSQGHQTVLYFYYSGHADENELQLGRTGLAWTELRTMLDNSGADVRVGIVDACRSGAMTRQKGGTREPSFVFDLSESLDSKGTVILTSSAEDESSQESDEIGGSYFTHFLVSALSGMADEDGDGRVTLGETYRQVFHETVLRTATTRGGTQHPTYDWELSGTGDLVITELERVSGSLVLSGGHPGTFAIFDEDRRMFIAEVQVLGADRRLSLRPGRYIVQKRFPTYLSVARVQVGSGTPVRVEEGQFSALEYEEDSAKGVVQAQIRKAKAPDLVLAPQVGWRSFGQNIAASYFPSSVNLGLSASLHWWGAPFVVADASAGLGVGLLNVPQLSYQIPTVVAGFTAGAGVGLETPEALFGAGLGVHLEFFSLGRSFPDQDIPQQWLVTLAPGLMAHAGFYPGKASIELGFRTHYLPYLLDGRDLGVGYHTLTLSAGYRF